MSRVAPRVAGLVLAAGRSHRFGAPKQLAAIAGRPMLEHVLAAHAAVPAFNRVAVTLGAHAEEILARVDLHDATPILVDRWQEGIAASLRAGITALGPHADAIVISLGDQPWITTETIARIAAEAGGRAPAARATFEGRPAHPVLVTAALYKTMRNLRGDRGARDLLDEIGATEIACDRTVVLDVDTPKDLTDTARGIRASAVPWRASSRGRSGR